MFFVLPIGSDVQVNVYRRVIGGLLRGIGDFLVDGPLVRAGLAAAPKPSPKHGAVVET
jgi:hypothetical protein